MCNAGIDCCYYLCDDVTRITNIIIKIRCRMIKFISSITFLFLLVQVSGCADIDVRYGKLSDADYFELNRGDIIGTDVDKNGVRDDIDALIASESRNNAELGFALAQLAKAEQESVASFVSPASRSDIEKRRLRAISCLMFVDINSSYRLASEIKSKTLNTKDRRWVYFTNDVSPSEKLHMIQPPKKESCDFLKWRVDY